MSKGNRVALSEMILQDILKENEQLKKLMTWIKVTERLPKVYKSVLVATENGNVSVGRINRDGIWYESGYRCLFASDVIAWMPLPEYKEDEG